MQTLTYGFKLPETGDLGNVFFPALEDNITQLNSHDHDGSDSAAISVANLTKSSASILAASWAATSGGTYRQEITLPSGFTYANTMFKFKINGGTHDGDTIYPSVEVGTAANKYYIYINDSTIAITALYV